MLRGSGGQTTQRVYWSNKATAITADVPSEAELTPEAVGQMEDRQGERSLSKMPRPPGVPPTVGSDCLLQQSGYFRP